MNSWNYSILGYAPVLLQHVYQKQVLDMLQTPTLFLKKVDWRISPLHWFSSMPALPDLAVLFSNRLPVQTILEHLL